MAGVYISYPFCTQKCTFCNFASGVSGPEVRLRYERALLTEIDRHSWEWHPETVYFGGGTPSLMDAGLLQALMSRILGGHVNETTLECAPGTITDNRIRNWLECKINRVSLGVQSFVTDELRRTGRRHTADIVQNELTLLRDHGISNINIDLIAGLPGQTWQSWRTSLDWIERLRPPHVSVYIFEVDGDSRLGKELILDGSRYGAGLVPDDDLIASFYEEAVERLAKLGILRYEISNFAVPGFESRHNLKYWQSEPYIGFGLDAHSFNGSERWGNPDSLPAYLSALEAQAFQPAREKAELQEEKFFIGLRLTRGIRPSDSEWDRFEKPIARWSELGLLERQDGTLRLSPRGMLMSNEVLQEFVNVE